MSRGRKNRGRGKTQNSHIKINSHLCKACWVCISACPKQVIDKVGFLWHKHIIIRNGENCTGCGKCIKICPHSVFVKI